MFHLFRGRNVILRARNHRRVAERRGRDPGQLHRIIVALPGAKTGMAIHLLSRPELEELLTRVIVHGKKKEADQLMRILEEAAREKETNWQNNTTFNLGVSIACGFISGLILYSMTK